MRSEKSPGGRKFLIPLIAVMAALGVLAGIGAPHVIPKNFGVVEEGKIYRSGQLTPGAFERMHDKHHFKTVIDLGSYEPHQRGDQRNQQVADALGVQRYLFDLEGDATGNPNQYVQVLQLMLDPANQPVLVHCGAGSERTSCVMILYDHIVRGTPIEEGYQKAREFKHREHRNPHLRKVLEQWSGPIIDAVRENRQIEGQPQLPEPIPVGADR